MSVLLATSLGEIVVDLAVEESPALCSNFLQLCAAKYYNGCLFYNVQEGFIAQCGDPTGSGSGGTCAAGYVLFDSARGSYLAVTSMPPALSGESASRRRPALGGVSSLRPSSRLIAGNSEQTMPAQRSLELKHNRIGTLSMVNMSGDTVGSQFLLTLREHCAALDRSHFVIGHVAEGQGILTQLSELFCDEKGRPYQDVRLWHTYVLDDPFPAPAGLVVPPSSPAAAIPKAEQLPPRIAYEDSVAQLQGRGDPDATKPSAEEVAERQAEAEARSRAVVLQMLGDLPDADIKAPDEVLFVCKLNPITQDEDLETIFARFGHIKQCQIQRDWKTGESLCYAFIEYEDKDARDMAYRKMNNVLIDDRRIKVDFSQSVAKLWRQSRGGGTRGGTASLASAARGELRAEHARTLEAPGAASVASTAAPARCRSRDRHDLRSKHDGSSSRASGHDNSHRHRSHHSERRHRSRSRERRSDHDRHQHHRSRSPRRHHRSHRR